MRRQILAYDGLQACPYRDGQVARLPLYRQLGRLDPDATDQAFAAGERRVGRALYHTACPTCRACEPIRVLCNDFEPSRGQRRVAQRWNGVGRVTIGVAVADATRVALYNRHKQERNLSIVDDEPMSVEAYHAWLVDSCVPTVEMAYWLGDRLVGIGIVDVGRTAASSVYFYFDPDREIAKLSPGVWSVLTEIEFCRRTKRSHLYLGLYVEDCRHLVYKSDYGPHERFVDGDWRRFPEMT